ncbi:ATP-dependent sacrificial sulfur transferase LarE [Gloeobacter violaceus]|uniref:Gll2047 protein n=1 Tax=Gloeobacter violaceus (strain ATCC 29082 / PCC 7421) TaxID=251221 RepID=Q7NIY5_GLOVI|nr:ATP-dependent sacrificial sulfur transferase LarE [Gloeobacter violaceus]BAC89988.1 gll2047 [Gloeobacter violaceus PCC 7421]
MLQTKHTKLIDIFASLDRVLVAYSGGVDSTLVAKVAFDALGDRALAVTAASPSLMAEDLEEAVRQAAQIGIAHEIIETTELDDPNYTSNPANRCYFCKSELHGRLVPLATARGIEVVVDGANLDDLGDYRPGFQAAREKGIRSPLIEVGLTKLEVRELSRGLGLSTWDKPAMPCLSSRFPYGEAIDREKLLRLAAAERFMRSLGERQFRVRSAGDTARIELAPERIKEFVLRVDLAELVKAFQSFGYSLVTLDLEGYRSGKLNAALSPEQLQRFTQKP